MTQRMSAPWVQGRGHKVRLEAMSGEDSRIETGGLSSFLDDSDGISATIARRASAAAGAFLVTEVPHAPYGPSRGLPVTPHQRLRPRLRSPSRSKDGCCPSLSGLRTSPGAVSRSARTWALDKVGRNR